MSAAEALQSVERLKSLTLEGRSVARNIVEAVTRAEIEQNIDGSSVFEVSIHDSSRALINSSFMKRATIAKIDKRAYKLVKVRKVRDDVTLTFEDLAIAELRKHRKPIKVAPGTTTHVAFVRRLVREESWLRLVVPPDVRPPRAQVELGRGDPDRGPIPGMDQTPEDSWTAIGRIGEERGWRRFIRDQNQVWYVPDTWLYRQRPSFRIRENANGVDEIDFDFDVGKPIATARVIARAGRWAVPVGSVIEIQKTGAADGRWLVSSIRRDLFSLNVDIELTQPQPELPEPEPQSALGSSDPGESGYGASQQPGMGAGSGGSSEAVNRLVSAALSQRGKPYVWGGKTTRGFDCSGLVAYATRQAGRTLEGASVTQRNRCRQAGTMMSVEQGINTRGALLFRITGAGSQSNPNHVAISLGNGQTIEARGRAWGVGTFSARGRGFREAARVPGLRY